MLAALCLLGAAGCRPARVPFHGQVTLDGLPLDEAIIQFIPSGNGRKKVSAPVVQGQYELSLENGLLPGSYRVDVVDNPPLLPNPHAAAATGPPAAPPARRPFPYHYAHHSPLSIDVDPADAGHEFDFQLSSRP